jgi:hypothetical protein
MATEANWIAAAFRGARTGRPWTVEEEQAFWEYLELYGNQITTIKNIDAKGKDVLKDRSLAELSEKTESLKVRFFRTHSFKGSLPFNCKKYK